MRCYNCERWFCLAAADAGSVCYYCGADNADYIHHYDEVRIENNIDDNDGQ